MSKPILIIDPGHGGSDPGAVANGLKEKDIVLDISLYQYERFKTLGVPVTMTRTDDTYLTPADRTKKVRESGAKYCISNHINAGGGDGLEVIHSIHSTNLFGQMVSAEVQKVGQNVRRVFTKSATSNPNKDYYFMHRDTGSVTTNIIEYGFIDNEKDIKEVLDWKYDLAEAVVKAFCDYIGHKYTPPVKKTDNKKVVDEIMKTFSKYFEDVPLQWQAADIDFVKEKGIMGGTGANKFEPEKTLTRGELAVVVARLIRMFQK